MNIKESDDLMYYFYVLFSLAGDCMITLENNLVQSLKDIWRPVVIFPLFFIACVMAHVIVMCLVSLFADKSKPCRKMNSIFRTITLQTIDLIMHIGRMRIHVSGAEMLPEDIRFLLIGNHISVFDPMIAMRVFSDKDLAFVSKKENVEIPFFGRLMVASGCLALDRENNRSAVRTIKQASEQITGNLASMGIYPEGGINKSENVLLPFHSGSFKIAKKSNAPIAVTTIRNSNKVIRRFLFAHTDIYVDIIRVIQPEEYSCLKTPELSDMVWSIMYRHLSGRCISAFEAENMETASDSQPA